MNREDLKNYFRILQQPPAKDKRAMINEGRHVPPEAEEEDVEEIARYDALNDRVDATLYRDNPDYRRAFKETLLNPVQDAPSPPSRS